VDFELLSNSLTFKCRNPQLPGGELMDYLKKNRKFPEHTTRFYAATVVLAFEQLHPLVIAYRDLKPENIVLSREGYGKCPILCVYLVLAALTPLLH